MESERKGSEPSKSSDEDTNGSFEIIDEAEVNTDKDMDGWEDILGSGHLMKKLIKPGKENTRPDRNEVCYIRYEGRYGDVIVEKSDRMKIHVTEGDVIQGLDMIVPLMNVSETCMVRVSSRFAYGSHGLIVNGKVILPPEASLEYTVELLEGREEPNLEEIPMEEFRENGLAKKQRGNWWYSRDDYSSALGCYKRALAFFECVNRDDIKQKISSEDEKEIKDEILKTCNNVAAALLKTQDPSAAVEFLDRILIADADNVKALFRKGKALAMKGERSEALEYYERAVRIQPEDKTLQSEYVRLKNQISADSRKVRKMYEKMISGQGKDNASTEASSKKAVDTGFTNKFAMISGFVSLVVAVLAYKYYS